MVLSEDNKMLDEVVVIGYGTTSTRKMASAVTAVKGEKLQDLPFNSVALHWPTCNRCYCTIIRW